MIHARQVKAIDWWGLLQRVDFVILLVVGAVCVTAWMFAEVADEVLEGEAASFDERVLLAFRVDGDINDPIGPAWFEEMVRDITALGSTGVLTLVVVCIVGALWLNGEPRAALLVAVAVSSGAALSSGLKEAFQRPRPDIVPHVAEVYSLSFPSGHSMTSAVVFLVLGALLSRLFPKRRMKLYFIAAALGVAFLVGMSRIYLGVHYPTDVAAGWIAGTAWALVWWLVAEWLIRRGTLRPHRSAPQADEVAP